MKNNGQKTQELFLTAMDAVLTMNRAVDKFEGSGFDVERQRRRNYMREYHKKYYREHKAKRSEYFRQRHIRKKHEKEAKTV